MKKVFKLTIAILVLIVITTGCEKNKFDLNDTKTFTFGKLKVEIPSVFERDTENSDNDLVFFNFDANDKNICMMNFLKDEKYPSTDLKNTISENIYGKSNIEYSTKNINGAIWTVGYYKESEKGIQHVYAIVYNNTEYVFSFDDFGSGDLCDQAFQKIVNSLKFN